MSKAVKQWARKARAELLAKHGNRCATCGALGFAVELQFDCIVRRGDAHHRHDTSQRMSFYRREDRAGNLQALCPACHSAKTNLETEAEQLISLLANYGVRASLSLEPARRHTEEPF